MNFALRLTMDGMIRALRIKAHAIGDGYEPDWRNAEERNEEALTLLSAEARRHALEAGYEFRG
jgi:hypothetical protein